MSESERDEAEALRSAGTGRGVRLAALFEECRPRLERMVEARMDPALRARLGASDVLQETWLEVQGRVDEWVRDPSMPFYLWVRFLAAQRLLKLRRFHVGAKKRDARRQVAVLPSGPEATTASLVAHLVATGASPSGVAALGEMRRRLAEVLDAMDATDREVLALRHFEEMSNAEVARTLAIEPDAASKRYLRALARLKEAYARAEDAGPSRT
jgi:RNA polymerase sigma-70 factor, ECF subfamily